MSELDSPALEAMDFVRRINRRDFMLAAAAIAGTVGVAFIVPMSNAFAALPKGIRVMGEEEYVVFKRLMEVMLPVKGTPLVQLSKVPVMQTLDGALLATMPPHVWNGLKGGVKYFNEGPKAEFGKKFVELTNAEAERFLDKWANSAEVPQRALAMGLKKLVGLAYWANPPTWKPLGYDGPISKKSRLVSYGNAPMPK